MDIREKLAEGWIHSRVIIEILGKPEDHVKKAMQVYIDRITEDKDIIITNKHFSDLEPQKSMFSAFVELEILTKDLINLVWFCFDYLPSSVEIMEPENLVLKSQQLSSFLNELQARLHKIGTELKIANQTTKVLTKNAHNILKNLIFHCLTKKELNLEDLSKHTGIPAEQLQPYLDLYVKDKVIQKKGEIFSLK